MTLQELHELTGKVLKERPEFASYEVIISADFNSVSGLYLVKEAVTPYLYITGTLEPIDETDILLWQAN